MHGVPDPQLCRNAKKPNAEKEFALPVRRFEVQGENLQESFRANSSHHNPKSLVRVFLILEILLSTKGPNLFDDPRHEGLCGCRICHHATTMPESSNERRDYRQ